MFPNIYDILMAVHHEMEIREWAENLIKKSKSTELDEALKKCQELEAENKALKQKVVLLEEDVELWRTLYEIEVVK